MAMCLCTPIVPLWRAQGQLSLSLPPTSRTLGRSWSSPVSVTAVNTPEIRTEISLPIQQPAQLSTLRDTLSQVGTVGEA
jgi:hypothetical protein